MRWVDKAPMSIRRTAFETARGLFGRVTTTEAATAYTSRDLAIAVAMRFARGKPGAVESSRRMVQRAYRSYKEVQGERFPLRTPFRMRVCEQLWRGSRLDGDDAKALSEKSLHEALVALDEMGIACLIDLRSEPSHDGAISRASGVRLERFRVLDESAPSFGQVARFFDVLSDPRNQPAYLHCQGGMGRTGVMVACLRIAVHGWSLDEAVAEMRVFFPSKHLPPLQEQFLRRFSRAIEKQHPLFAPHKLATWRAALSDPRVMRTR
jgi:hypothetical protein